ncbi:hypothetical protein [Phaeodactylibacter luteus]|uniref:hypothetical protein n=1 Tax=Phaeodactylibacter luteus TaxID=1564516 RepID=UPI001478F7AE|nr:hypothetical protein [Phaeodactylibacter luteus]
MNAKQTFLSIVIGGAAVYFFIKYLPDIERLFENGASALFAVLVLLILGFMGYRVLSS